MKKLVLVLVALAAGCAFFPFSQADCKPASWRQRGYEHGFAGHWPQDLRLVPECRERFGVEVATADYHAGWRDGRFEWERLIGTFQRRNR